jgi:amidase
MRFLRDRQWTEKSDAYLATKLRAAGFAIVGKTNTPELASSMTTEPEAYGPTRNPWNLAHSTGGSSGGAAAAVASRMVPAAHGNDMGGSIRVPASECGLVGLKPTRARTSLGPAFGEYWGPLTHEGVLTRSVRDTAGILDAIAGAMPGDPYLAPPPARPLLSEVGTAPGKLRVGVLTRVSRHGVEAHADCVAAVRETARLLSDLGHDVEESAPSVLEEFDFLARFSVVFTVALARDLERWSQKTGAAITASDVETSTWVIAQAGRTVSATAYMTAIEEMQGAVRALASWWAGPDAHDLLLCPVLPVPPPELGLLSSAANPFANYPLMPQLPAFTIPWNSSGQPAISLPLHWNPAGLPIGVQLVAAYGREDVLIRIASQLESARPWADRRPPIA